MSSADRKIRRTMMKNELERKGWKTRALHHFYGEIIKGKDTTRYTSTGRKKHG